MKNNIVPIYVLIVCCLLSGCTKLKYLDELLALKGFAEEQDEIADYIDDQKEKMDALAVHIDEGSLTHAEDQASIVAQYGEPIFKSSFPGDLQDDEAQMWVYRYSAEFNPPFKVYLFFDEAGQLVRWNKEAFPHGGDPSPEGM
ncbi:MAG: hypothetical protein KC713_04355 [Candidatus Omnitrophica bacterium]|nr:hypothetical protein [Candidatus Omnitrophota bacterium]